MKIMCAIPIFKDKYNSNPLYSCIDYMSYIDYMDFHPFPDKAIMIFQSSLNKYFAAKAEKTWSFSLGKAHLIKYLGKSIVVCGDFGIGAPAAVIMLEALAASGVKTLISIGSAGAISNELDIADCLICKSALRDEGTSWHYEGGENYSYADKGLTEKFASYLKNTDIPFFTGSSWTIDAPYMETREEIRAYSSKGIKTVEMEASALFIVARKRGIKMTSAFVISDILYSKDWKPRFHSKKVTKRLERLSEEALSFFAFTKG